MANLTEQASYEPGIYQLELTDPLQGGANGVSNIQAKQLANRTRYLKEQFEAAHNIDGTHDAESVKTSLEGALTDLHFAPGANIDESKVALAFRGAQRPSSMGEYTSTLDLVEDVVRLDTMNSLGDLLLSQSTINMVQNLCKQLYTSSGVLLAGASDLAGHTAISNGVEGGGIFTMDTPSSILSNKLQVAGRIQHLLNGYCVSPLSPAVITLPDADVEYRIGGRSDLVYFKVRKSNVTTTNVFYLQGDMTTGELSWSSLTAEEQKVAASILENNLYIESDYNIYQLQYAWAVAPNATTLTDIGYTADPGDTHLFTNGSDTAIEICKVSRRNQGAYHSVFNPLGTAVFYGSSMALEENQVVHSGPAYDITNVDIATNTFTIAGDHAAEFTLGTTFNVTGAILGVDDNSRDYMVASSSVVSTDTLITVTHDITINTGANGAINTGWPAAPFYDIIDTDTTAQTFTIAGDHTSEFPVGYLIEVVGASIENDGDHLVSACSLEGGNTVVTVPTAILNTGPTGSIHSILWFHITYCFSRISMTVEGPSGSIASGVVAASADSSNAEVQYAHDHIMPVDIVDVRVYLPTAVRDADPNLTLNTPILVGVPSSVYELEVIPCTIGAYNGALNYTITAENALDGTQVGDITLDASSLTLGIPEVAEGITIKLSIYAEDTSSHISQTSVYTIQVNNLEITGDDVVLVDDSSWQSTTGVTVDSGLLAITEDAEGTTVDFEQGEGEAAWGKYQIVASRGLNALVIDEASTMTSLVLDGESALSVGQVFAVKYEGSDEVTITTLNVTEASWNAVASQNTLTLSPALSNTPEMLWVWDGEVSIALGTELEALVPETELTIDEAASTTSQVVGDSGISSLWAAGGYHDTVKITVAGEEKTVTVISIVEDAGTYTLQIPVQSAAPTTMVKPSCYVPTGDPTSVVYDNASDSIVVTYNEVPTLGNSIRKFKFNVGIQDVGTSITGLQANLWTEV